MIRRACRRFECSLVQEVRRTENSSLVRGLGEPLLALARSALVAHFLRQFEWCQRSVTPSVPVWKGAALFLPSVLGATRTLIARRGRPLAWGRAFVSSNAAWSVGLLLILSSALALLGWVADIWWLMQPLRSFPPMRVASALGFLILGIGISSTSSPRLRGAVIACGMLDLLLGAVTLQHSVGLDGLSSIFASIPGPTRANWHGEMPGQVAVSSGVFVLLGGVGLLAIISRIKGRWSSITLAASGGIVMVLATTVFAGQVAGVMDGIKSGPLLGSSFQSLICAIAFATHFNALAWTKETGFAPPPDWLPLSAGAGALVTVLFLWRALLMSEEQQLENQSRVVARVTRAAVVRQLSVSQRTLQRMALHSVAPDAMWSSFVTQMTLDVEGLETVMWTDSAGYRLGSDTRSSPDDMRRVAVALAGYVRNPSPLRQSPRYFAMPNDSSRALLVVPRCRQARCTDLFVGVINAQTVLRAVMTDTVLGFGMAIGTRDRWFRSSASPPASTSRFLAIEPVLDSGPSWQLGVWPSARTAAITPSSLSDLVLLLGVGVSVLLAIALRLAQSVSQTARLEERAHLDEALQTTTDGLWEWDISPDIVTRTPQLWDRLGYTPAARSDNGHSSMQDWLALVHPQDRVRVEEQLTDHLESRADVFDAQYRVKSAAGRWHDFIDRGRVVLRSPTGKPLRLLGMFADVTDRRHAEESVRQAETMSTMGRLAGRIAHEINNPLAGIQSAFMLIKDAIPATHPHIKYVGAIEREIQRISQVTRQLYETYRPETESSSNAPVQTVVSDAVAFLEQLNRNTGVTINVELGNIAAVVRLPESILRQCVYNLVQNAIEASPPGSRVTVSGAIEGSEFVLRVSDRGPGVPLELRDSIFDPFVSTKPSQLSTGGMGLGLSLVRRALDAAGGGIEVTDAVGGGAEFVARIPLAETPVHGVTA